MKTRYYLPILICVVAALSSCNKEQPAPVDEVSGELITLEATIGEPGTRIHFSGDYGTYTEARWEQDDCIWVRSDTQPAWERGDCFKVSSISSDGHTASFTGRSRKDGKLCAVYPYGLVNGMSTNDEVQLDIADTQNIVPGDCPEGSNAAVAFWADGSTSFSMKYIFGAVKFSLTGEGLELSYFELSDANTSNALYGTCVVTPDYSAKDIKAVEMKGKAYSNKLRLVPASPVTLGGTPYEFYVMLPEGALEGGFTLKAYDADSNLLASLSTDKSNAVVRGKVLKMPAAEMKESSPAVVELEGSGTVDDPYKIDSPEALSMISGKLAGGSYGDFADKYYLQTSDIDMSGVDFIPIGQTSDKPFGGHYDGAGKTISNLVTEGASSDNPASGVFGYADGATITGVVVNGRGNSGSYNRVGGVVGYAKDCTVSDCRYTGGELTATTNMCAGIVGHQAGGVITGCEMTGGKITSTGPYAAGIVAYCTNGASVENCTVSGGSTISGTYGVGGICARIDKGSVRNCAFKGSSVEASSYYAAAIVGSSMGNGDCVIDNCIVTGNSSVCATYCAAGILGYVYPESGLSIVVSNCGVLGGVIRSTSCDTGADPSKGDCMSAGIVGWLRTSNAGCKGTIVNCYVYVSPGGFPCDLAMKHPSVGGIVGYVSTKNDSGNEILVANCATTTLQSDITVAGSPVSDVSSGGPVGSVFGWGTNSSTVTFSNCHYLNSSALTVGCGNCNVADCEGYSESVFKDGSTVIGKLNASRSSYGSGMLEWIVSDGLPVLKAE